MSAIALTAEQDLSPSRRAADLFREAKALAEANTLDFVARLEDLIERAAQIAQGGDVYAPGVRALCKTFSDVGASRAQAINSALREQPAAPPLHALERRRAVADPVPSRFAADSGVMLSPEARLAPTAAIVLQLAGFSRRAATSDEPT